MYILTGVNKTSGQVRIYDTEDGSNEVGSIEQIVGNLQANGGLSIRGIRFYDQDAIYPPDAWEWTEYGAVIIPSEAHE